MTSAKCLWNSVVSTDNGRFMAIDIKNYYLGTPLDRPELVHISMIPQEIVDKYDLTAKQDSQGFVYIRIEKGMYGLPQSGILANKLLARRLAKHGYYQTRHTPGLWRHVTCPLQFVLVVDDFGIEYVNKADAQHLIAALKQHYEITVDWEGTLFSGITLKWHYKNRTVDLSMPGYVEAALLKFQHSAPTKPENQPYKHNVPQYGAKIQYVEEADKTPRLNKEGVTRLQQVVGTMLFYARAVDPTMLVA
jgi:hypothetical protein